MLVVKMGRYRKHHGGVAVIRSLGRAGVPVYAVVEDRATPAARSRHLTAAFVAAGDVIASIPSLLERIGGHAVLITTDDDATVKVDEARAMLPAGVVLPERRPGLAAALVDKISCRRLVEQAGLPVPPEIRLRCPLPAADLASVPVPSVVKRARRRLLEDGSRTYSTVLVRHRDELPALLCDERGGPYEVVVQELLAGEDWLYHGYLAAGSDVLLGCTGRKLRSRPAGAGETCLARTETNPQVQETCEHLLRTIGYAGPVSADLRSVRGTVHVLDVNPRVGACFRLFVTVEGTDVVRAMHADLSGVVQARGKQVDGRVYMVENYDWEVRHAYRSEARGWLRALATADERAWLALDDPKPTFALLRP